MNIDQLKQVEDLKAESAKLSKQVFEKIINPKIAESREQIMDSFKKYFESNGFTVEKIDDLSTAASYNEAKISLQANRPDEHYVGTLAVFDMLGKNANYQIRLVRFSGMQMSYTSGTSSQNPNDAEVQTNKYNDEIARYKQQLSDPEYYKLGVCYRNNNLRDKKLSATIEISEISTIFDDFIANM